MKFIFSEELKKVADEMPDELRLKFYDELTEYMFRGVEPENPVVNALIKAFKPKLAEEEKETKKRFIKPTIEEISAYCQERQNEVSAESFHSFYESKGWKVGNQPMKDWKAAVRTWEKHNKNTNKEDFWSQLGC